MNLHRALAIIVLVLGLVAAAACDLGTVPAPTAIPALSPVVTATLPPTPPADTVTPAPIVPTLAPATAPAAPATLPPATPTATVPAAPATLPPPATLPATTTPLPAATLPPATAPPAAAAYLVYVKEDGSLWRSDGPGPAPLRLAPPSEPGARIPWAASPDGRTVAYVSGTGVWDNSPQGAKPALALWMVAADGTGRRQVQNLLPARPIDLTPMGDDTDLLQALTNRQAVVWSPDSSRVAFVSAHENQVDLYTATRDGQITRLTNTPALETGPRWAPDGRHVAVITTSGFGTGAGWADAGLVVLPAGGGPPTHTFNALKLFSGPAANVISDMVWIGADSLVVHFDLYPRGNAEVGLLALGTGRVMPILTAESDVFAGLQWSAAARMLAIAGTQADASNGQLGKGAPGLYLWRPGMAQATQLTADYVRVVAWNPTGTALAYTGFADSPHTGVRLWAPGQAGVGVTLRATPAEFLAWAPDGSRLAAGAAIYDRGGHPMGTLPGAAVTAGGWGPQGFFFSPDGSTLSLWDGKVRRLDTGLAGFDWGQVVLAKP